MKASLAAFVVAIENFLTKKLGDIGKKIHTGRSRNDQVLTALRLFYKDEITKLNELSAQFVSAVSALKKKHGAIALPGFTHTRKAMPSSVELWCDAFIDSMEDNKQLLAAITVLIDQSPLGTGAGYGIPLPLDRSFTAKKLGFARAQQNPIYAQNSRGKFESSLVHALTQIMIDLNKMASDIILFSMPEFCYFILPPKFCTGSSIMPQKKNPDVLELVRGKYAVVLACEFEIKTLNSNLISGYNRDMQLLKEPTFRALETTKNCLNIMSLVAGNLSVDAGACKHALTPELFATEKAYALVKKGMPFREAYQKIAKEFEEK